DSRGASWGSVPEQLPGTRSTNETAKADMARRGVHRFRMTRGRAVTAAVIRRTQMRTALQHLARNPDIRLARIVARILMTPPRIGRDAAARLCIRCVHGAVPAPCPF